MIETHVSVSGARTKLLRGGAGAPLLYLHSEGGETMWLPFHEALAEHADVLAPAHPGFDSSEGLERIRDMEDLVFHYLDLCDALGLARVDVVGLSLGGWIAAELATRYPERVRKLVLVGAAGLWVPGAPIGPLWELQRNPEALRRALFADPESPLAQMLILQPEEMPEDLLLLQLKAGEATARVGWNPYLHNPKLAGRLARVRSPTLVVWGREDRFIPLAHGEAYARGIPGARKVTLPGCGHLPIFERPAELVAAIAAFLRE